MGFFSEVNFYCLIKLSTAWVILGSPIAAVSLAGHVLSLISISGNTPLSWIGFCPSITVKLVTKCTE